MGESFLVALFWRLFFNSTMTEDHKRKMREWKCGWFEGFGIVACIFGAFFLFCLVLIKISGPVR